jgi:hypothetical protein
MDGNFHHRHRRSAGDAPSPHNPQYFISKDVVDVVGQRIEEARKKPAKRYQPKVPDEAIDECENSYDAADEKKAKADAKIFDDTGLMALVCRHDLPILFANIDTPGE